ncbi:hypothetical protein SFC57_02510 [Niallia circulans]|uniref:hypothetical protein n=1 Tax=Niallia circulans TaxID=1397 RepID=UPI00397A3BE7
MELPIELVQILANAKGIRYEESESKLINAVNAFVTIKEAFNNVMNHIARIFEKIKDCFDKSMYIEHEKEYGYSIINPLKNQVLNRKPSTIRARTCC